MTNQEYSFYQTEVAQKMGVYKETQIDVNKRESDFLLVNVRPYMIKWANGNNEIITKKRLIQLQKLYVWECDF